MTPEFTNDPARELERAIGILKHLMTEAPVLGNHMRIATVALEQGDFDRAMINITLLRGHVEALEKGLAVFDTAMAIVTGADRP